MSELLRDSMDVYGHTRAVFLSVANRSTHPPPIMTDNSSVVVAPLADASQADSIQTYFADLARRLGPAWQAAQGPYGHITFSGDVHQSDLDAALFALHNPQSLKSVTFSNNQLFVKRKMYHEIKLSKLTSPGQEGSCTICHNDVSRKERVAQLSCKHWFHIVCIKDWLGCSNDCPLCRADVKAPARGSPVIED